jgi:hypothetical protein
VRGVLGKWGEVQVQGWAEGGGNRGGGGVRMVR